MENGIENKRESALTFSTFSIGNGTAFCQSSGQMGGTSEHNNVGKLILSSWPVEVFAKLCQCQFQPGGLLHHAGLHGHPADAHNHALFFCCAAGRFASDLPDWRRAFGPHTRLNPSHHPSRPNLPLDRRLHHFRHATVHLRVQLLLCLLSAHKWPAAAQVSGEGH
jgi:hypothetical protein